MLTLTKALSTQLTQTMQCDYFWDAQTHIEDSLTAPEKIAWAEIVKKQQHATYKQIVREAVTLGFVELASIQRLVELHIEFQHNIYHTSPYQEYLNNPLLSEAAKLQSVTSHLLLSHHQQPLTCNPSASLQECTMAERQQALDILESSLKRLPPGHPKVHQRLLYHQGSYIAWFRSVVNDQQWRGSRFELDQGLILGVNNAGLQREVCFISHPKIEQPELKFSSDDSQLIITVPAFNLIAHSENICNVLQAYCVDQKAADDVIPLLTPVIDPANKESANA